MTIHWFNKITSTHSNRNEHIIKFGDHRRIFNEIKIFFAENSRAIDF